MPTVCTDLMKKLTLLMFHQKTNSSIEPVLVDTLNNWLLDVPHLRITFKLSVDFDKENRPQPFWIIFTFAVKTVTAASLDFKNEDTYNKAAHSGLCLTALLAK